MSITVMGLESVSRCIAYQQGVLSAFTPLTPHIQHILYSSTTQGRDIIPLLIYMLLHLVCSLITLDSLCGAPRRRVGLYAFYLVWRTTSEQYS